MKIHLVGPYYGYSYCVNKAIERAANLLGHSVAITDPRSSLRHGKDFRKEITSSDADIFLCTSIEGWHRAFLDVKLPRKVLWLREEIRRPIIKQYVEEVKDFYDDIFYFDQSSFHHFSEEPYFLPLAMDPTVHFREDKERDLGIVFIGSIDSKEGNFYKSRTYALDLIRKSNLPFYNFRSWDPRKISGIYSRANIIWNLGSYWSESGAVEELKAFGYQNRVFEGMASGGLMFNHKVVGGSIFDNRKHLVEYDGTNMIELLEKYLSNREEAREIAECGYSEVLENHTYRNRLEEILRVRRC